MTRHLARWLGALAALLHAGSPLHGQTPTTHPDAEGTAQRAISELKSPFCPGLMLETCPTPQADSLEAEIGRMAAAGQTKEQIVEAVLARYGEQWRGVPKPSGAGLWAWLIPPLALLGGLTLVGGRLRRATAARVTPPSGTISAEEQAELADALREFDREEARP